MPGILNWGWDPANKVWVPLKVSPDGTIYTMETVDHLNDIGDVSVAAPADNDLLYYDSAAHLWKSRKLVDADIPAAIARDAEVATAVSDHANLTTGVHGLKGEVGFSAHQTSNQAIPTGTWTIIDWHAKDWDVGGYFDLANNRYLPLIAGRYFFQTGVQLTAIADGTEVFMGVWKNGAISKFVTRIVVGGLCTLVLSGGCLVYLNGSTDYIDIRMAHHHGADRNTGGEPPRTWFQGFLIAQS